MYIHLYPMPDRSSQMSEIISYFPGLKFHAVPGSSEPLKRTLKQNGRRFSSGIDQANRNTTPSPAGLMVIMILIVTLICVVSLMIMMMMIVIMMIVTCMCIHIYIYM